MAFIRELALPVLAFTLALSFCEVQVSSQVTGRPFFVTNNVSTNPGTNQLSDSRTSKLSPVSFNEVFNILWGADHQRLFKDQSGIEIWLDKNSGSGFKSLRSYNFGYFSASIKLQAGYTAGTNTAFYLSNNEAHPDYHDEIDIEFLGNVAGKPYTLQTNIYIKSPSITSGQIVTGREEKTNLWFDPTTTFHRYTIEWTSSKIVFSVDNVVIRTYHRTDDNTFPLRPMWVYGTIWDASSWATENGKYKVDYKYQPFVAQYSDFAISGN